MPERRFLLTWLVLAILLGVLALGVPRNAGPDEPAHAIRAAGLVRGQVLGAGTADGDAYRTFDVPLWAGQPDPSCYATHPEIAAGCSTVLSTDGSGDLVSTAGSYPVLGHLVPGLATLVPIGAQSLFLARLFGAAVWSGIVAAALGRVARRGPLALLAVLLALTPAALFTLVVINPSGGAVVGALAMMVSLRDLGGGDRSAALLWTIGSACLLLTRPDGWLWGVALVVVAAAAWGRGAVRQARIALGPTHSIITASMFVIAVAWAIAVRPALVELPQPAHGLDLLAAVFARSSEHVDETIGLFGWYDTRIPAIASYAWWGLVGAGAVLASWHGRARGALVAAGAMVAAVVIGWAADLVSADSVGLVWQGRYALPLVVAGLVCLGGGPGDAMASGGVGSLWPDVGARRACAGIAAIWVVAFWQAFRRWSVGSTGSPFPWQWERGAAAVHPFLLIVVFAVATAGLMAVLVGRPHARDAGGADSVASP